ncbi:DNA-binding SARP family transcriptional activator [Kitasatospora sp. MAP12-15]|uniref:AfsR/SARP family transcriptional regulator n=1 Tax=unclassified Kitasatospora TaxID=2633591 RepID=UPI00247664D2|nr:AfsR/SARP family transcriptional regulator [Kitasatospora sp. MAP12-44]MDH6113828.1 DNA-binding SARP family transcriptional activator [Kitasatospora sp. MAP12-44]
MDFGILGPLLVRDDAGLRSVPAAKQRVLLAALLVRPGQLTPAELLAETVWDGRPPRSASTALRNYVMRLRQALGTAGERIETRAGGYLIHVEPEEFDVQRFAALRDQGVAALRRGAFELAAGRLDEALGLWRGSALVDVPSDLLQREEGERLAEDRLHAVEAKLEAELRLGRRSVISDLRTLTAAHPGRERFWAQLMTALYRDGRQSEALTVYQQVRRILDEEIGVEPGSELREVHQRILCADRLMDNPMASEISEPLTSVQAASGPRAGEQAAELVVTPFQLPPDLADFTGRAAELAELTGRLTASGRTAPFVAVLSGQPGVGKSALAGRLGHAVRSAYPGGVLFADLHGSDRDPALPCTVLGSFLLALGVPLRTLPVGLDARTALYRSVLADRRVLVVLDNARDSVQVRPLLPNTAASAVLVTSRTRLIDLTGAHPLALEVPSAPEAAELFGRLLGPARASAEPAATAELTAACGRLPLALRICAARLAARGSWDVRHLADRLADEPRLFDELRVGTLDVQAAFVLSHDALAPETARAFRLLSLPDAAVLEVPGAARLLDVAPAHCEQLLEQLVDAHLLVSGAPGHYGYESLLRAFARRQSLLRDSEQDRARALGRTQPRLALVPSQRTGGRSSLLAAL